MPSKRKADAPNVPSTSLRFFRRIFGRIHTRQRSQTSNKYRGARKKKNPFGFERKNIPFGTAKCEGSNVTAKCEGSGATAKQTHSRSAIADCWLLNKLYRWIPRIFLGHLHLTPPHFRYIILFHWRNSILCSTFLLLLIHLRLWSLHEGWRIYKIARPVIFTNAVVLVLTI